MNRSDQQFPFGEEPEKQSQQTTREEDWNDEPEGHQEPPQNPFPGFQTWTSTTPHRARAARQVPFLDSPPATLPPPHPMPTQGYQQRSAPPPYAPTGAGPGLSMYPPLPKMDQSVLPPLVFPAPPPPKPSRVNMPLLFTLVALVILVAGGSILNLRRTTITPIDSIVDPNQPGAFAQAPLNSLQIDQLRNLTKRMGYKQLASLYVSRMSLDEELGQLIMVEYNDTTYSADIDKMITQLHAGGVIMYEFQMLTATQTKNDIAQMQKNARLPLLISSDEEGGIVHRLSHIYPPRLSALAIYQTGDPKVATAEGAKVAHDLSVLGINVNLAPDVDVALRPNAPDQYTRTFGFTVDSVNTFAGAYMQAMQKGGVIATIKHYPGLGDADIDAHEGLPIIHRTKDQLYAVELATFKHFIQSSNKLENPGMIMSTDVLMPAIDARYPAELSPIFMTNILRKEFGYDGVAITDALYMKGVQVNGVQVPMPEAAVMALNAGNDMLLGPTGAGQMIEMLNALKTALQKGTLSKARVDEAATRIIALKMQSHLMPAVPPA